MKIWHGVWTLCCIFILTGCTSQLLAPLPTPVGDLVTELPPVGTVAYLNTSSDTVAVGKTLVVDVEIKNVEQLFGMALQMVFNPTQLEVVDSATTEPGVQITHGGFLSPDYVQENQVDNATGTVSYILLQVAPTEPANGQGILATLVLRGKASGKLDISISELLLSDPDGNSISVTIVQ